MILRSEVGTDYQSSPAPSPHKQRVNTPSLPSIVPVISRSPLPASSPLSPSPPSSLSSLPEDLAPPASAVQAPDSGDLHAISLTGRESQQILDDYEAEENEAQRVTLTSQLLSARTNLFKAQTDIREADEYLLVNHGADTITEREDFVRLRQLRLLQVPDAEEAVRQSMLAIERYNDKHRESSFSTHSILN